MARWAPLAIGATILVAAVAVLLALLAPGDGRGAAPVAGPTPGSPSPSGRWPSSIEAREDAIQPFVPPTHEEGDRLVMPVTFPDGTTAEIAYPPELDLAGEGLRPYGSGGLLRAGRDFSIVRGRVEDAIAWRGGADLLAEYPDGRGGTVGLWDIRAQGDPHYLGFQLGSWAVLVYDYVRGPASMTEEERGLWSRSLRGYETGSGFLVLEAEEPLRLAAAGEHAGPELMLGTLNPRVVLLFPGPCEEHRPDRGVSAEDELDETGEIVMSRSRGFASWCDPGGLMAVHVYQDPGDGYIERVARGLQIRDVRLASG